MDIYMYIHMHHSCHKYTDTHIYGYVCIYTCITGALDILIQIYIYGYICIYACITGPLDILIQMYIY